MKRSEIMRQVSRVVKAAGWTITCPHPPYPHTEVIHWGDLVGPKQYRPMLGIEDRESLPSPYRPKRRGRRREDEIL